MKCNTKVYWIICIIVILVLPYLILYSVPNDTISKLYLSFMKINKTSLNIFVSNITITGVTKTSSCPGSNITITGVTKTSAYPSSKITIKTSARPGTNISITVVTKTSACPGITFQLNMSQTEKWQPVDTNKTFVFSAYLLNNKEITVIGIRIVQSLDLYCQIWTLEKTTVSVSMVEVVARSKDLPEPHGKRYTATLFKCSVSSDIVPTHVSVVTSHCNTPTNMLILMSKPVTSSTNYQRNFTVCLSPLHFKFSNIHNLIEWIELNRILGAEWFSVYNYSSHENVARVLEFYSKRGLVEVIQWPIGVMLDGNNNIHDEIHYFGQVAALHDCLFRNKASSRFLVYVDLDEFIIPREKGITTWKQMLDKINDNACVYVFRNTFFRKDWKNSNITINDSAKVEKFRLITLQNLERNKLISLHGTRSKYILRTANVSSVVIHNVRCNHENLVPMETGLLHHYRDWGSKNSNPSEVREFDDTISVKYGVQLIKCVKDTWLQINEHAFNKLYV